MANQHLWIEVGTSGTKQASNSLKEISSSAKDASKNLSLLQQTMSNMELSAPMRAVVANFKKAVSEIKDADPRKYLDAWKQFDTQLKDIKGADLMARSMESLTTALSPKEIMEAWGNIGDEFKRKADIVNEAEKVAQQAQKESAQAARQAAKEQAAAQREASAAAKQAARENKITAEKLKWEERLKAEAVQQSAKASAKATDEMSNAVKRGNGILSNFWGSLARIAKLRLLRGIVRAFTQAIKEGTENIYQYSIAMGKADASHFASTMDSLASAFLYLKNSVGAVVAPLLSALLPALQTIVSWVALALDYLAQFFAVINGQSTYTRAKKQATAWKDVGSAAGGAAAAAKEYKNTIMSFDEIHALNDTPSSGGGGGGGASAPGYTDMFEEASLGKNIFTSLGKLFSKDGVIGKAAGMITDVVGFAIEGISPALSYLWGTITGDIEMCEQAWKELQEAFASHETVQRIMRIGNTIWQKVDGFISDIRLAFWDSIQSIINDLSPLLELVGIDVDKVTTKIENNKKKIQDHKAETAGYIAYFNAWMTGLDETEASVVGKTIEATVRAAQSTSDAMKFIGDAKDKATGVSKDIDGVTTSWGAYTQAVYDAQMERFTGANVTGGLDEISRKTDTAYWKIYNLRDELGRLGGTTVHFSLSGTVHGGSGFEFKNGGFVMANGGIIPRFDGGGINTAQLFIANENGSSELIGNIGNRTAVANQGQMVEAMAQGVYMAMSDVMSSSNNNTEVNVYMNDEVVARAADRGQRSLNRRFNVSLA